MVDQLSFPDEEFPHLAGSRFPPALTECQMVRRRHDSERSPPRTATGEHHDGADHRHRARTTLSVESSTVSSVTARVSAMSRPRRPPVSCWRPGHEEQGLRRPDDDRAAPIHRRTCPGITSATTSCRRSPHRRSTSRASSSGLRRIRPFDSSDARRRADVGDAPVLPAGHVDRRVATWRRPTDPPPSPTGEATDSIARCSRPSCPASSCSRPR